MAYPYLPAMGYPYQMQTMTQYTPQTQAQSQSNIIWVQGIEAMKSYPVNAVTIVADFRAKMPVRT